MSIEAELAEIPDDRARYYAALQHIVSKDPDECGGTAGYALFANLVANLALKVHEVDR